MRIRHTQAYLLAYIYLVVTFVTILTIMRHSLYICHHTEINVYAICDTIIGDFFKTVYVHDQHWYCSYNGNVTDSKCNLCSKTGIPENMQMLYYRQHASDNKKSLPNGTSVILSIGLYGGMSNCEICYESATHFCKDCQGVFCSNYCTKFHKHPSRLAHSPHVLVCNSAATSVGASNMACSFDVFPGKGGGGGNGPWLRY